MLRKISLAVLFLMMIPSGFVSAADSSSVARLRETAIPDRFSGIVPLYGKTPKSSPGICHVDNVARTIQSIFERSGGTYLGGSDNTLTPITATISCDDKATRWYFQVSPTTTLGHKIPADGSWQPAGPNALGYLSGIAASASDNVACAITLWY